MGRGGLLQHLEIIFIHISIGTHAHTTTHTRARTLTHKNRHTDIHKQTGTTPPQKHLPRKTTHPNPVPKIQKTSQH